MTNDLDGRSVLYPYLQKELLREDVWLFQMLTARLVTSLGIWLSPAIYQRLPVLLPYAIRDESARERRNGTERWGSPTPDGLFRDDNSLIKEEVKSLTISSPRPNYQGRKIGRRGGWVASHVWRLREDGTLTNREPVTNSFVPNVVWLPTELSKLSDRTGFVQRYLQAIAHKLYAGLDVHDGVAHIVEEAWSQLDIPSDIPEQGLPSRSDLNFFMPDARWLDFRIKRIGSVLEALECAAAGEPIPPGRYKRFRQHLPELDELGTQPLRTSLQRYLSGLLAASDSPSE